MKVSIKKKEIVTLIDKDKINIMITTLIKKIKRFLKTIRLCFEKDYKELQIDLEPVKRFDRINDVDKEFFFESVRDVIAFANIIAKLRVICLIIIDYFDIELQRVLLSTQRSQNQKLFET